MNQAPLIGKGILAFERYFEKTPFVIHAHSDSPSLDDMGELPVRLLMVDSLAHFDQFIKDMGDRKDYIFKAPKENLQRIPHLYDTVFTKCGAVSIRFL